MELFQENSGDGNSSSKNYKHLLILNAYGDLYGITSNEESWKRYSRFARMDYTNSGSIYADHFYENSDIRYKHNIKSRTIEITDLASLPIFDYTWKDSIEINTGTSAQAV